MPDYLLHLNQRLVEGLSRIAEDRRRLHAAWILARQNPDGGWSGRDGGSDLYYTSFALRGLAILDQLDPPTCAKTAAFLHSCLTRQTSVVDFFSFLYGCFITQLAGGPDVLAQSPADWPTRVASLLDTFRTPDHGYNKSPGANSGSTYHTFLVGLCFELLGQGYPHPDAVSRFTRGRRRQDGGFVEVAPMRRGGTNPTAAAIGILQLIHGFNLPADDVEPTIAFLLQMPADDGGLRANDRVPLADLLSTFTGLWTLDSLGALNRVDHAALAQFLDMVEQPQGGFKGGLWDEATDVEYTFYGLGSLALLGS